MQQFIIYNLEHKQHWKKAYSYHLQIIWCANWSIWWTSRIPPAPIVTNAIRPQCIFALLVVSMHECFIIKLPRLIHLGWVEGFHCICIFKKKIITGFVGQALCKSCRENTHRAKMFSSHDIVQMSKRLADKTEIVSHTCT